MGKVLLSLDVSGDESGSAVEKKKKRVENQRILLFSLDEKRSKAHTALNAGFEQPAEHAQQAVRFGEGDSSRGLRKRGSEEGEEGGPRGSRPRGTVRPVGDTTQRPTLSGEGTGHTASDRPTRFGMWWGHPGDAPRGGGTSVTQSLGVSPCRNVVTPTLSSRSSWFLQVLVAMCLKDRFLTMAVGNLFANLLLNKH